jgi:hypothetical protein
MVNNGVREASDPVGGASADRSCPGRFEQGGPAPDMAVIGTALHRVLLRRPAELPT